MERLTIRIPEEIAEEIEERVAADDVSQSEAARRLLRRGSEYDRIRRERDRLRDQLAARNAREEDVGELVEYVEQERRLNQRREQRRQAPVWRRAAWWVFGEPDPELND